MKSSVIFTTLSALLLLLSAGTVFILDAPELSGSLPFQWWIHIALIGIVFYGLWRLKRLRKASATSISSFFQGFPLWLGILAIPVAILVVPMFSSDTFSLGTTPTGEPVHRKSWFEESGHFYLRLNKGPAIEISPAEYQALQRGMYEFFARIWVLFSYASLTLWHYVWRRELFASNAG